MGRKLKRTKQGRVWELRKHFYLLISSIFLLEVEFQLTNQSPFTLISGGSCLFKIISFKILVFLHFVFHLGIVLANSQGVCSFTSY